MCSGNFRLLRNVAEGLLGADLKPLKSLGVAGFGELLVNVRLETGCSMYNVDLSSLGLWAEGTEGPM